MSPGRESDPMGVRTILSEVLLRRGALAQIEIRCGDCGRPIMEKFFLRVTLKA